MKNQSRIPGVDTFRFFAFLNVFLFHATSQWSVGYLGVQGFFVLSSFLLTYLALQEISATGSFSRVRFFLRRGLRIYPLYFLIVALCFYVLPVLANTFHHKISLPDNQWKYWFFLSNLDSGEHIFALKFLWSISVEEQFYLLFILISPLFRRHIYIPIIALIAASFVAIPVSNATGIATYYNPLSYTQDFAMGMLAAKLYVDSPKWLSSRLLQIVTAVSVLFVAACFYIPALDMGTGLSVAIFASSLILTSIRFFGRLSNSKWLPAITEVGGRYTYGLYVYSGFALTFASMFLAGWNEVLVFVIESAVLVVVAYASYHLFEKRFLDLKSLARYRTPARAVQSPAPMPSLELAPARIAIR